VHAYVTLFAKPSARPKTATNLQQFRNGTGTCIVFFLLILEGDTLFFGPQRRPPKEGVPPAAKPLPLHPLDKAELGMCLNR